MGLVVAVITTRPPLPFDTILVAADREEWRRKFFGQVDERHGRVGCGHFVRVRSSLAYVISTVIAQPGRSRKWGRRRRTLRSAISLWSSSRSSDAVEPAQRIGDTRKSAIARSMQGWSPRVRGSLKGNTY